MNQKTKKRWGEAPRLRPKNIRQGYHLNSRYWQEYKASLPCLPDRIFDIAVGMILGDASISKVSREAHIKFEQGYKQEAFLYHLFHQFHLYSFMEEPGKRVDLRGKRLGYTKSFWFKTFSHCSFTKLWRLFYNTTTKRKSISNGLVLNHLTSEGLAYWIMCDRSLQNNRKTMILHTQGYTRDENILLSRELYLKFGLNSKVIPHKSKYSVIEIAAKDSELLSNLVKPYIIPSMEYKLPRLVQNDFSEKAKGGGASRTR